MSKAMQERGQLEEKYGQLFEAVMAADNPGERKRLLFSLDEVNGERLAHEMENGVEFMAHNRALLEE